MLDSREVPSLINAVCLVLKKKIWLHSCFRDKKQCHASFRDWIKNWLIKMFSIGVGPAACIVLNAQELTFWQKGGGKSHRLVNYRLKWVKSKVSHRRIFIIK